MQVASDGANVSQELGCTVEEPNFTLDYPMDFFLTIFSTNAYTSYGDVYEKHKDLLTDYV